MRGFLDYPSERRTMEMNGLERGFWFLLFTLALAFSSACEGFTPGPSLEVEVPRESLSLQPTTANSQLCCCRVVGSITNRSSVPVHVTLKFEAYQAGEEEAVAAAVDFLENMQPGEQRSIDASGFLIACSSIDRFELVDIDLRGVWVPPS
jgi:hypothetical protein